MGHGLDILSAHIRNANICPTEQMYVSLFFGGPNFCHGLSMSSKLLGGNALVAGYGQFLIRRGHISVMLYGLVSLNPPLDHDKTCYQFFIAKL